MAVKVYLVGGAVRDQLLNLPIKERDFVVVGSSPEQMHGQGYKPVGADFPVFIHPQTGEEYALARTEKKVGHGYRGFVFYSEKTITLQQDLKRRDLTINAIAQDIDSGEIHDYYNGRRDIQNKILRHVSAAFSEDPVRILRTARFAAQLPDFTVAEETMQLMRQMVAQGELQHLHPDRIWKELAKGLCARRPSQMINTLEQCGALAVMLPEVAALKGVPERLDYHPEGESYTHTLMVLDTAAAEQADLSVRFAALVHDIGKALTPASILPSHYGHEGRSFQLTKKIIQRFAPPKHIGDIALTVAKEHGNIHRVLEMRPSSVVDLLGRLDALRRPDRLQNILQACEADYHYWHGRKKSDYLQSPFLRQCLSAMQAVDQKSIAEQTQQKHPQNAAQKIAEKIRYAHIKAVKHLAENNGS